MKMKRVKLLQAFLGFALCAFTTFAQGEPPTGHKVGQRALDFILQDLEGQDVQLLEQRGKVVVLTFWDWNCIECREGSLPQLQERLKDALEKELLTVLAVNISPQPDVERLKRYAQEKGLTYPILLHGMQVALDYWVFTIPMLLVIDQEGVIRYRQHQALADEALALIETLLPAEPQDKSGN